MRKMNGKRFILGLMALICLRLSGRLCQVKTDL